MFVSDSASDDKRKIPKPQLFSSARNDEEQDNLQDTYTGPTTNKRKKMMIIKKIISFSKRKSRNDGSSGGAKKAVPLFHTKERSIKRNQPSSSSSSSANTLLVSGNGCFPIPGNANSMCFCFKQPPTLESSSSTTLQSQTSDPNHPNFNFDMLKSLIENNDFYSKECNPH